MRWYDFMTVFWAALIGAASGVVLYWLASSDPGKAWAFGAFGAAGGAVAVALWREFKNPR